MSQHTSINVIYGMKFDSDLLDEVLSDDTLDLIYSDNLKELDAIVTDYNKIFVGKVQYHVNDMHAPIDISYQVIELTEDEKVKLEYDINNALGSTMWSDIKLHVVIQYG